MEISTNEKTDEDALQWAVLEKLPTYNRLRKGLLAEVGGNFRQIDVKNLGFQKIDLVERLLNSGAVDNKEFLLKLRERIERVGIDIPTIEVRFEHLCVEAQVHVGSRALPTIFNSVLNTLEGILNFLKFLPRSKRPLQILQDVSGIIKHGRMTLLLGPPSSGKTTLLLALSGRLNKDLKATGSVTYNGHSMKDFVPQRSSAYISQYDLHIPEMTVRETLAFSRRCQGVGTNYDMLVELLRREKAANITPDFDVDIYMKEAALADQDANIVIDYILKILGLDICADTVVGNQMIRGISGGERKRLTTGEMLVGPAKAFFMDEISTGLDTSTTFQILKSIGQSIHILKGTAVISLLQPAPEIYDLFDDVILVSDGQIIYQGPTESVLEFFESMGFKCPERKGVADYLQEVTSRRDQEQYWMFKDEPHVFVSAEDFAEAFRKFHVGKKLDAEICVAFDESKSHPGSLTRKKYGVNKKELFKACVSREILLMKRHSFVYIFKMCQMTFMAFVALTVFLRTNNPKKTLVDGHIYMGALFFGIIRVMFNGMAEITLTISEIPVFYKQRDFLLYPAWAYTLPKWILKIPMSIIDGAIWVSVTYYGIGFDTNFERFFRQWLVLVILHQTTSALYRFVAGLGRKMAIANTLGTFVLSMYVILSGFVLSQDSLKKWLKWIQWLSPLMYAQNAVAVNEFLGQSWSNVLPNATETLGVQVLKSRALFTSSYWYSIGVLALIGLCFLFNFLFTLALTYLNSPGKPHAAKSEKVQKKLKAIELQTKNSSHDEKGVVLPFEPLSITFEDIRYAIDTPQKMKDHGVAGDRLELLKGISGAFRPGVLTALMGVSGAGKTTLMDVLAGRKTSGYVQGTIKISGYPKKQETFARISGYVEQSDIHSPYLTVYESLLFSAWLRLPSEVHSETREMFIWEVMELVELTSLSGALVGLPGINGLSIEQRKRLTIALELVANPSIIFMDEPTSGLDARAAAIVMRTVKNTVNTGRTVVCTIHQPSIDIFDAFDELLLLKRGGEEIYFGPVGSRAQILIKYFEEIDGVSKIKKGQNPATWMMDISSVSQEARLGLSFTKIYKQSELYRQTKALIKELSVPCSGSKDLHFPNKHSQSFFTQSMACLWKQHWSYWRNTEYNGLRLFYTCVLGLAIGTIFWKLASKRGMKQDLFNAMGCMYVAVHFLGIRNALSVQPVVAVERAVFYREKAAGMYSALAYALSQVIMEIPYCFVQTGIYGFIIYDMIGFERTLLKMCWFMYFTFFTLLYYTYYGMMTVAISPNQGIASITSTVFFAMWNLFSGFIVPKTRIPIWWRWYYWVCPVAWSLYGMLVSQFGDVEDKLEDGESVKDFLKNYFGFEREFLGVVAVIILVFPTIFALVYAYAINTLNFQKR